jgi:hypothetical protein
MLPFGPPQRPHERVGHDRKGNINARLVPEAAGSTKYAP